MCTTKLYKQAMVGVHSAFPYNTLGFFERIGQHMDFINYALRQ